LHYVSSWLAVLGVVPRPDKVVAGPTVENVLSGIEDEVVAVESYLGVVYRVTPE
jgi:hypothetical protein